MHCALWLEDTTQRAKPDVGVGEVMEHACADDMVEGIPKLLDPLNRELVEL